MSNSTVQIEGTAQTQTSAKMRKPYHTPRLENYGTVSELTRGGGVPPINDGTVNFTYASGN